MDSYDSLYRKLLAASVENRLPETVESLRASVSAEGSGGALLALLHPEGLPPVVPLPGDCGCNENGPARCQLGCLFSAIKRDEAGRIVISTDDCVGCLECIRNCGEGRLKERRDLVPLFETLNERRVPVFAMIAPAFIGQFASAVTVGKLRNAFKKLGFQGMVEVALFADILTLKEALEFDRLVRSERDFVLTSCCCPVWVAMIRRKYGELASHVPPSVSPMVACGRAIKKIHPDARTVFIGPCLAKKAEAREADVADAVDYVLTFRETEDILSVAGIDVAALEDDEKDHSSAAGRIYARTGGVSRAVERTLRGMVGQREIPLAAVQADGVPQCKALLESVSRGEVGANFLEGMGCAGGCVGGPRVMVDPAQGARNVEEYGEAATYASPLDNPYTFEFLRRLGYDTVESLLEREDNLFIREFD